MSNPSLILPQSPAYGEDYVYAAQVEDGAVPLYNVLPLTFTRASGGTRINKDGLVQNMPYNLLEYSEDFSNAIWTKLNGTITTNTTTAPNGTTTADTITDNSTNGQHVIYESLVVSGGQYTFSYYAKANTLNYCAIRLYDGTVYDSAIFNLSNGTKGSGDGEIESVGNGWYRVSLTKNIVSGTLYVNLNLSNGSTISYVGSGQSVYIWGAQVNIGSTAQPYLATTDRLNIPRITYPVGGGCGALLLEKQSTNEAVNSNALSTTPNVVDSCTTTANVYVSPDGTQNAMRFTETTDVDRHGFYQYTTVTAQTYTASIFTKQTGRRYIAFNSDMTDGVNRASYFDLQTISVVSASSGYNCSIEDFGNGWLRLIVTFTVSSGAVGFRYVIWGGSPNGSTYVYAGSTSFSQTFYGYQLEASSYATSYIPTTSTSATRIADVCYKTGISNLIGQTEGTLYGEMLVNPSGESLLLWPRNGSAGLYGNFIYLGTDSNKAPRVQVVNGGVVQAEIIGGSALTSTWHKFAFAYKTNDFAFYVDGVQIGTDTSGVVPSGMNEIYFDQYIDGGIRNAAKKNIYIYQTRLTNAELATLTTI